jgi:Arc/MetJ family transcription regulator
MRFSVDLKEELVREALDTTGLPSLELAIHEGLRLLVQMSAQKRLLELAGTVEFAEGYDPEDGDDD